MSADVLARVRRATTDMPLQRLRWRLAGGIPGHRKHGARPVPGSSFWWGYCQCTWSERTISRGAAEGALRAHLRSAQPWVVNTPAEFIGDDVEEHLTAAAHTLGLICERPNPPAEFIAVRDRVAVALDHYRKRLTQP